jgi:hypothetical protein
MATEEPIPPAAPVAAEVVSAPTPIVAPTTTPEPVASPPPVAPSVARDAPTLITPKAPAPSPETEAVADPLEPAPTAAPPAEPLDAEKPPEAAPTLLETTPEKPPEGEKPAEEATKAAEAAAGKTYEPFKLPEDIKVDDKALDGFREIAGKHNLDQETAQSLLDMHTSTLKDYAQKLQAKQWNDFQSTQEGWIKKIKADPMLGGSGFDTALTAAARMRDLVVTEPYRQEYMEFCRDTGAGNHPALMRIFYNFARMFDEPAAPPIAARPVPDRGGSAKKSAKELMYDNPTSRRAAGRG